MADDPKKPNTGTPASGTPAPQPASRPPIGSSTQVATRRTITGGYPVPSGLPSIKQDIKPSIAEALRETQDAVQEAVRELTGKHAVAAPVAVVKPTAEQIKAADALAEKGARPSAPPAQAAPSAPAAPSAVAAPGSPNVQPPPAFAAPAGDKPPAEMVTVKIDGRAVQVPKGTNLLEACLSAGTDVSYFCYHRGLSSPAVCRQCLVEIAGQPKLVPSCYTPVADKMEVVTNSERVTLARQQMLEFTLVNHPVDCPICDKAGECTLQKLYMEWDGKDSRTQVDKVHKPKAVDLGPHIVLDAERCILCTRCIRVCDEVAGQHQLEMTFRGDRETLDVAPGQRLDNPYSLNTVDVCPVGALTSKDFRFRLRAWELFTVDTVCPGCSTGCNVEVHHGQGQVWRLVPRENQEVNKFWMCDEGRFTYRELQGRRVAGARVGQGRGLPMQVSSVEKAVSFAAQRMGKVQDEGGAIGIVFGAQAQNEALFGLSQVADIMQHSGSKIFRYQSGRAPVPERQDRVLREADVNPNSAGAALLGGLSGRAPQPFGQLLEDLQAGRLRALWMVGEDVPLTEAELAAALPHFDKLELFVVQAVHDTPLTRRAQVLLPAAAWAEVDGSFTNKRGRVQRLRRAVKPAGEAKGHLELISLLGQRMGVSMGQPWQNGAKNAFLQMCGAVAQSLPPDAAEGHPAWGFGQADWGRERPPLQLRFANSRG